MALTKADIQFIRSLAGRRERLAAGLFVAEGAKLIDDLCRTSLKIRCIYTTGSVSPAMMGSDIIAISNKEMERISQFKTATPYLALVEIPRYKLCIAELRNELTLALDDVQDPGNLGTIIRLADWFGIRNVICSPHTADCFNTKVIQATMGAIARVHVHYTDLGSFLTQAISSGLSCYGTFLRGDNLFQCELKPTGIIVMGNEGNGISDAIANQISTRLFIPPYPRGAATSESLNVATATAILCAEFRRRTL